jgi:hypothetical protein
LTNLKYIQTSEETKVNISCRTTPYKMDSMPESLANGMTELGLLLEPKVGEDTGKYTRLRLWREVENTAGDKEWYYDTTGFDRVD